MPRWLRNAYVLPAFVASVAWFDIFADEVVEVAPAPPRPCQAQSRTQPLMHPLRLNRRI
jgi:hypothetical protein